jgi:hypothetical protein
VGAAERIGAPTQIRLSQLSVFNRPPKPRILGVLKGYFDDSRTEGEIWAIAGFIGDEHQWSSFEDMWPLALATHGVPWFHRREMSKPTGVFAKWYPANEHEPELAAFQSDLAKVIGQSGIRAFGSLTRIKDLKRFNAEHRLRLDPYALAAYGCMLIAGKRHLGQPVELIFDHLEKVHDKLARARTYADSDNYYGPDGVFKKVMTNGLAEEVTFKEVTPIQAADFWVWEWRKHQLKLGGWHDLHGKPKDWNARWLQMQQYFVESELTLRKSAQALLERAEFTAAIIWDYENLCNAHDARGGVWS